MNYWSLRDKLGSCKCRKCENSAPVEIALQELDGNTGHLVTGHCDNATGGPFCSDSNTPAAHRKARDPGDAPHGSALSTILLRAARLCVDYPNQDFNRQTIKRTLQKLCQVGKLRRLGRDRQGFMLCAAPTCDAARLYGNSPASALMAEILKESPPIRPVEFQ